MNLIYELLGMLLAWFEVMFALIIMTVGGVNELNGRGTLMDWLPLMGGINDTLGNRLLPRVILDAYESAAATLWELLPE